MSKMKFNLEYKPYGKKAILIKWSSIIDDNVHKNVMLFKTKIKKIYIKEILEVIIAYNSLLII